MPEPIYRAMVALAIQVGWLRWAGNTTTSFEGCSRPGEPLRALRKDLLRPSDMLVKDGECRLLKVRKPKPGKRGKYLVQHFKVDNPAEVKFSEAVFREVEASKKLYPASASTYRLRWDRLLAMLEVPTSLKLTPGGMRGGGAVSAYKRGKPLTEILWQMRIKHLSTLESYLQEVAAESVLPQLSEASRRKIKTLSSLFEVSLQSAAATL